jgi:hypothetical protein
MSVLQKILKKLSLKEDKSFLLLSGNQRNIIYHLAVLIKFMLIGSG